MDVLLDTSIIIEYTRTQRGLLKELFDKDFSSSSDIRLCISVLTMTEFWSGHSMRQSKVEKLAEVLFSRFEAVPVEAKIAKQAGKLRQNIRIETVDSIIAATALEKNCFLATLNQKHFEKVPGLKLWPQK